MTSVLKWNDLEYKREYYRNYYHRNKVLKNNRKNVDWNDPEAVRKYHAEFYQEKKEKHGTFICEVCRCEVVDSKRHNSSKKHKDALVVLEKLRLMNNVISQ